MVLVGEVSVRYNPEVGGRMGVQPEFARFICAGETKKVKVPAELVHLAIERLVRAWQADRRDGQSFAAWSSAQPMSRLADLVGVGDDSAAAD